MKKIILPILFSLAVTICRADGPYHFIKDIPIGGDGGWDALTVDSAAQQLYVSHATNVITWEADEVISLSKMATVSAVAFQNCLKIKENSSDGDTEYKLYAPDVGVIEEIDGKNQLPLKSHEAK